jgi:hypothetical protein
MTENEIGDVVVDCAKRMHMRPANRTAITLRYAAPADECNPPSVHLTY